MCLYKNRGKKSIELENVVGCILLVIPSYFKAPSSPGGFASRAHRGGVGGWSRFLCPEAVILFVHS